MAPTQQARYGFDGGLRLPHFKRLSTGSRVLQLPAPQRVILPLKQHMGETAAATVSVGDMVTRGQVIARSAALLSAPIHASISGQVIALEERPVPHPSNLPAPCVVIEKAGEDADSNAEELQANALPMLDSNTSPQSLLQRLREAGVVGLGGAVFPAHVKLLNARGDSDAAGNLELLIVNGAECEPYIACDDMLMREQADEIVQGTRLLARLLHANQTIIAVEQDRPEALQAMTHALRTLRQEPEGPTIDLVEVPMVYPEGGERQLIQSLTGREVPSGGLPLDIGMVCLNVATVAAAWRAVRHGRTLTDRIVTVTGHGIKQPRNIRALLGTPVSDLVRTCGGYTGDIARLVMGGPMMGFALATDAVPVVKATNCILALTEADIRQPQPQMPCIRCGNCVEVCPARLLPQQLYFALGASDLDAAQDLALADCIECGCCARVCPSQIPLVDYYRHGKAQLRQREHQQTEAALARQRFEARQQRLAEARAEKQARRQRRKQRLDNTDQRQAEIQRAIARAKSRSGDGPGEQQRNSGE